MAFTHTQFIAESAAAKKKRAAKILRILKKSYPKAKIALRYNTPMQLLVSVMLSAQATDKKVNEVTTALFQKYKTARDFANADRKIFEQEIRQTGFYRAKAKNIIAAAQKIEKEFGGKLPTTMREMTSLRGVARKTANIVLGNAYGIIEGIAVDTHVQRISGRLGLTRYTDMQKVEKKKTDPNNIEKDLVGLFPKKEWFALTYKMINHGRAVCTAKKPACDCCLLNALCASAFAFPHFKTHPQA